MHIQSVNYLQRLWDPFKEGPTDRCIVLKGYVGALAVPCCRACCLLAAASMLLLSSERMRALKKRLITNWEGDIESCRHKTIQDSIPLPNITLCTSSCKKNQMSIAPPWLRRLDSVALVLQLLISYCSLCDAARMVQSQHGLPYLLQFVPPKYYVALKLGLCLGKLARLALVGGLQSEGKRSPFRTGALSKSIASIQKHVRAITHANTSPWHAELKEMVMGLFRGHRANMYAGQ
eukprot:826140-Pelagomonas_calceolata.AAC.4